MKTNISTGIIFTVLQLLFLLLFVFSSIAFAADCPQVRKTPKAPGSFLSKANPLKPAPENISAGKLLYEKKAKPLPCVQCHGVNGNGVGKLAKGMTPHPRNFACQETMKKIPDGQLFWVIKNGSKGTGMMGFKLLKDNQIWQLILYIRGFGGE
ncbi:hypothetical protein UR09_03820 [Candidatus Nitromaritima sp. SCGC AAA799-A02]|nr:hypothetical protein UR09_03820 [Candidatus Nitromaritima sp. SCGC AAA799-A02]KMP12195.1 hypothetical protein UZ36_01925 [Candidatus Nitromaritima sp. SCGC AAA799-C22]